MLEVVFDEAERSRLQDLRAAVRPDVARIAYCVFENPFARSGGIFAVAENYCRTLEAIGREVVLISPFHSLLETAPAAGDTSTVGDSLAVRFDGKNVETTVLRHQSKGLEWFLVKADGLFTAVGTDPYRHEGHGRLLYESLFFCKAIPLVLKTIGYDENVIVHLQDWETAAAALTVKEAMLGGTLKSAAIVVTSHNPYDHPLTPEDLAKITAHRFAGPEPLYTVYQHMLPLADAPINTVSEGFAEELVSDPLMTEHFADHLQGVFGAKGLIGIDNGRFGEARPPYAKTVVKEAKRGRVETILKRKATKRAKMLDVLCRYKDDRIIGGLKGHDGAESTDLPDDVPVFFMFGRLDPGQKGFDVFARAIERMPRGVARFVLAPIVAGASEPYVRDLETLARRLEEEVALYPFRMQRGYMETMAGASFAVMPSLYEPFGAATEPYLGGTPVIARATGGLRQQVLDGQTGLLFREDSDRIPNLGEQWKRIQGATSPDDRRGIPLYEAVVEGLRAVLEEAVAIHRDEKRYAGMLTGLFDQACRFSWERAADQYLALYEQAAG